MFLMLSPSLRVREGSKSVVLQWFSLISLQPHESSLVKGC